MSVKIPWKDLEPDFNVSMKGFSKKIKLPDVVIHTYFKKFEEPLKKEGIEKIIKKGFTPDFKKYDETLFNQYF